MKKLTITSTDNRTYVTTENLTAAEIISLCEWVKAHTVANLLTHDKLEQINNVLTENHKMD